MVFRLADYAIGNALPGGLSPVNEQMSPALAARVEAMTAAMPPEVLQRFKIISGFRSPERNAQIYAEKGLPPSKDSRHSHGAALDLQSDPVVLDWINKNPQHGLGFPLQYTMKNEQNHLEMIDPNGKRVSVGYAATPTGFKSGLPTSEGTGNFGVASANLQLSPDIQAQVTPPQQQAPTPGVDPELLAALANQGSPLGGSGLSDIITKATAATNPTLQPRPIITDPTQQVGIGQPLPISRRLI